MLGVAAANLRGYRGAMPLDSLILEAWKKRAALRAEPDLDCYRVFHGFSEGAAAFVVDAYGPVAIIRFGEDQRDNVAAAAALLHEHCGFETVVAKERRGTAALVCGAEPEATVWVRENGLRLGIEPLQERNPGLYLDARPARQWLRANSAGLRLLNLFSFTGSLGLAASMGGARSVIHVDLQRRGHERCRENYKANGLSIDGRDLVRGNAYQHMRRAAKAGQRFDGIVVDVPPGLHRGSATSFEGTCGLAADLVSMLSENGWVLCFFHHIAQSHEAVEASFAQAAGCALKPLWRGTSGEDFPENDPTKKLRLSALAKA